MAINESNMKWWVLATVMIGTVLGRLDQTVVNLALPKMIDAFGITVSTAGWIATAYIIANAIFVPVWGKLGDTIGRKKVYIWGFSIFIVGSVLAGFAWNFGSMIVFRVIQAVASSADYPTAMAILAVTFQKGRERAQALGLWSSSFAASAILGPLVGGPLLDFFGWRSVFFVNLPVGLLGIFMAMTFIKESVSDRKTVNFDLFGALNLGIVLTGVVLVLDQGNTWGWTSWQSMTTYAIILIFGFFFYYFERKHEDPLIDFKFFKNTIFVGTMVNNFVVFMGMMSVAFLLSLFIQTFLGFGATQTGLMFIPMAFFMVIFSTIGARFVGRVKSNYILVVSTLVAALGLFLFSVMIDPRSSIWDIIIPLSVLAAGMGFGMSQRTSLIASAVPENEIGSASAVLALARNIAGAFGIALATFILTSSVNTQLVALAKHTIINSVNPVVFQQVVGLIILKAEVSSYATVFRISALIVLVGAILAWFMKIEHESDKKVFVEG